MTERLIMTLNVIISVLAKSNVITRDRIYMVFYVEVPIWPKVLKCWARHLFARYLTCAPPLGECYVFKSPPPTPTQFVSQSTLIIFTFLRNRRNAVTISSRCELRFERAKTWRKNTQIWLSDIERARGWREVIDEAEIQLGRWFHRLSGTGGKARKSAHRKTGMCAPVYIPLKIYCTLQLQLSGRLNGFIVTSGSLLQFTYVHEYYDKYANPTLCRKMIIFFFFSENLSVCVWVLHVANLTFYLFSRTRVAIAIVFGICC